MSAEEVSDYLRRHPDFLSQRPELLSVLTPPEMRRGDNVADMQSFMIERLRTELVRLRESHGALVSTTRGNMATQSRVHEVALEIIDAGSFEEMIETVMTDLPLRLEVDAVGLCVETDNIGIGGATRTGVRVLPAGTIDQILGEGREIVLRSTTVADTTVYGHAAAGLVKSEALIRLRVSPAAPVGLLGLGSREVGHFSPRQGTELLTFLARVIESTIRAWLQLPS